MKEEWINLKEKEEKEWRAKHGDIVIYLDGVGYTAKQLADRKRKAIIKADMIMKRLELLK